MKEQPIPPPSVPMADENGRLDQNWYDYLKYLESAVRSLLRGTEPGRVPPYAKAALPSAATWINGLIIVTDDVGGRVLAFSDGASWRRVTDRAVII